MGAHVSATRGTSDPRALVNQAAVRKQVSLRIMS